MASVEALHYPRVHWQPYLIMGGGIFVGSIGVVFIRNAQLAHIPTIAIAALRLLLTCAILTPFIWRQYQGQIRQLTPKDFIFTAVAGVMFAFGMIAGFESLNHTSVLIAGVLGSSVPLWVALMERGILKSPLHRNVWLGLTLALAGSTLISLSGLGGGTGIGSNPLLGGGLSLLSALVTAVYFLCGRSIRPHMSLAPYLWLLCGFAALTTLTIAFFTHTSLTGYSINGYFWVLLITLGPQLIVQSSFNYALAYFSATFVGLVTQLVTVGNAIAALIVYHEIPLPIQLAGSAIILAGVALANLRHHPKG